MLVIGPNVTIESTYASFNHNQVEITVSWKVINILYIRTYVRTYLNVRLCLSLSILRLKGSIVNCCMHWLLWYCLKAAMLVTRYWY